MNKPSLISCIRKCINIRNPYKMYRKKMNEYERESRRINYMNKTYGGDWFRDGDRMRYINRHSNSAAITDRQISINPSEVGEGNGK